MSEYTRCGADARAFLVGEDRRGNADAVEGP